MDLLVSRPRRAPFQWTARRLLVAGAVFLAPYALLALKLQLEASHGAAGPNGSGVLIRFAVVGLFACLMTKWCVDWMKRR
jgi:hypothetical protein